MYVAQNATLLTGRAPWPEAARIAAASGYKGVDIPLGPARQAGLDATKALLQQLNLRPAIADFPVDFRKGDAEFKASLPQLEEAAPFIAALGVPRMVTWILSSSDKPKDEQRRILKQRFTDAAAILQRSHVRLGLEFLGPLHIRRAQPYEFIWRMDEMTAFAQEIGPNVGLLLDAWHWHHAAATPSDILHAGAERIVHVHLADAPLLPAEQIKDNERLMPGEGYVNWKGFFHALRQVGYQDAMSVEVFGRGLKDMPPAAAAKLGATSAKAVLAAVGVTES